jgi:outer membrane immunogenic protein
MSGVFVLIKITTLCCALTLAPLSSPVNAADSASNEQVAHNWSGFYAGIQTGYSAGKIKALDSDAFGILARSTPNIDLLLGGLYAGYNYQTNGNFIFGIDGDINWAGGDTGVELLRDSNGNPIPPNSFRAKTSWDASARVRVGYAIDRFMPYVAGGLTFTGLRSIFDGVNDDAIINDTMSGWTIGAGVEYAARNSMTIRAEYRYSDFGSISAQNAPLFPNETQTIDLSSHSLLIGLSVPFAKTSAGQSIADAPDVRDWSGVYVGVLAGGSLSGFDVRSSFPDTERFNDSQIFSASGSMVGAEIGWNIQRDAFVYGLAADVSYLLTDGTGIIDVIDEDEIYRGDHSFFATARAKIGYSTGKTLAYVTGGLAVANADLSYENYSDRTRTVLDSPIENKRETLIGYTIGAGLEFGLSRSVSLKAEYLYTGFEIKTFDKFINEPKVKISTNILRAGLNYKF